MTVSRRREYFRKMDKEIKRNFRKRRKRKNREKKIKRIFCHIPGFLDFQNEEINGANMAKLAANEGGRAKSPTGRTAQNMISFKKAIRKLKGEGVYEISFPSLGWGGSIEVRCDAG